MEAKVNGSVPNFVLKSTRNQSKYLKHINKLFLFYPKDLDVLWLQKSPISITMTSHVPSDTMGLEDSPQSHLAMVNPYGRAFIYPILINLFYQKETPMEFWMGMPQTLGLAK